MIKNIILQLSGLFERTFSENDIIAGRYQILKHLGTGSYGHSYLVFDIESQNKKVLKALRLHKRLTYAGRRGFEAEKECLHSIRHEGFPQYFEEGIDKTIPFYTMEYINGKNFEQMIFGEGKVFPEIETFKIGYQLLEQIDYLHSRWIIHRDIRIPNVILDGTMVRLIDLGLARPLNREDKGGKAQERNLRKQLNCQADFYGLGHFLLFLLYSNHTFEKNEKERSWEEELAISNKAKHILRRLLQIESAYENCTEIKADIQIILSK